MMAEYDNTNRGVLFKGKKEQDSHPDYEGSINVGGKEYWLNAWLKTSSKGMKFMSLSVKPKDGKPAARNHPSVDSDSSEIPF